MLTCSQCGHASYEGATYCANCGNPFPLPAASAPPVNRCPNCEAVVVGNRKFCVNCGINLDAPPPNFGPRSEPVKLPFSGGLLFGLGLVGLLSCMFASIPAWVMGTKTVQAIKQNGGRHPDLGMARAGQVLGIIGTCFASICYIAGIIGLVAANRQFQSEQKVFEAQHSDQARHDALLSDGKQISMALMMYANDYDDNLPEPQQWTTDLVAPYTKNRNILTNFQYTFLGPYMTTLLNSPVNTELGYLPGLAVQDSSQRVVSFADGHAAWAPYDPPVTAEAIQKIWEVRYPLQVGDELRTSIEQRDLRKAGQELGIYGTIVESKYGTTVPHTLKVLVEGFDNYQFINGVFISPAGQATKSLITFDQRTLDKATEDNATGLNPTDQGIVKYIDETYDLKVRDIGSEGRFKVVRATDGFLLVKSESSNRLIRYQAIDENNLLIK